MDTKSNDDKEKAAVTTKHGKESLAVVVRTEQV
jgi:hypothetical protein